MITKLIAPMLAVFLAGCIVQSFYPFYTDRSTVALPQLNGEWDAVTAFGEKMDTAHVPPWRISGDQIVAYESDSSQPSQIHSIFFKAGGQLFCDSTAGDMGKGNLYWAWHTRPVHTVTKVETNTDMITFKPLNLDWLTNQVAAGKVSLPRLARPEDGNWPLFTVKPADWEKFLTKYANNAYAFPTNHIYVLRRHINMPVK